MEKKWLVHDTNSGCLRQSPPYNHCSIATDSKDVETMVLLNAASDEMSQNSNTHLKRFFLKFEGYLCVCVTEK